MSTGRTLENVEDVYPLSPMQQGMVFHTIAEPHSGVFVNQISTELSGQLDVLGFRDVWDQVVTRHAIMRTAFIWDGLDEPLQVVRQEAPLEWTEHDWMPLDRTEQDKRLAEVLDRDRRRGFDLATAPLARMMLIRMGHQSWRWVWSMHHLVADGWSTQVLLDEVFALYRARQASQPVALGDPFPYRDFIARQAERNESREEQYWRDRLAGFHSPHRLEVPGLPPASGPTGHRSHTVELDEVSTSRLRAMAGSESITLNTAVVGAWSLLLSRWTREQDIVFGVTMAGRDTTITGIERAVGLFINTLPLRLTVPPTARLGEWLRDLQKDQLEMRDFESSPLASVQRWADAPPGEPLFESIFVFENYPPSGKRDAGDRLTIGDMEYIEQSNYPLAVLVVPDERLSITLVYDSARFAPEAIASLGDQLHHLLGQFGEAPDQRLSSFGLVSPPREQQLRELDTGPAAPIDDRRVPEIIAEVARRHPGARAVVFEDRSLTYGELVREAEAVAARLVEAGVKPNRPVGLFLSRSPEMVIGMLGILKAGGAYVPLDPAYPPAHIAGLLEDDAIDIVLTEEARRTGVPDSITVVAIDAPGPPPQVSFPDPDGNDLAYVIHTSGSTGRPKGVMVTHQNLSRSTLARENHYRNPVGRFLLLSSFAFDSSVVGIFWTLSTGGTLVLPTTGLEQDVGRLLAVAADNHITHLLCLPALYQVLLEHAENDELSSLQVAIVAGEACPPGILTAHRDRLPDAELHNEYGPTEATVWCTAHRATEADLGIPLPIGRPIAGARIHLLDEHGRRVPRGFAGELCIAGAGVTPGYLNRPDLTAEKFVTVDLDGFPERLYRTGDLACYRADGTLAFLGRADLQLKVRGYRIETGAIEAALRSHPLVREAAVAGRAGAGRASAQLVGYVLPTNGADLSRVTADLSATLPAYMVPDVIVPLAELPRLPNGKTDYTRLPDPRSVDTGAPTFVAPRTETETTLAVIWADLLGVSSVGVEDDFFALGGDSIVSIQMISRARQAGVRIEPGQITAHPTIARLAAAATVPTVTGASAGPVSGPVPLGPIQRWFFESDLAAPHHWNQSSLFELPPDVDPDALRRAIQACVDHHDMLRARFERKEDKWHQVVDANREVALQVRTIEARDNNDPEFERYLYEAQSSLDLETGPLIRALLLRISEGDRSFLLLAVHHLIIDAVSWGVLAEDLDLAYQQALNRPAIDLPPRTTSYRDWVNHLMEEDRSNELAFWSHNGAPLTTSRENSRGGAGTEGSTGVVSAGLDEEATQRLLTSANEAYQTRPEDLLVAALASTLSEEQGADRVRMALEGHGRPIDAHGLDLSRTVGWFTAYYPLTLTTAPTDAELIMLIKEQLRAVPGDGIGYGALRYLNEEPALAAQHRPGILFNYLSRARDARPTGSFTLISTAEHSSRDPRNARTHPHEVVARVHRGRLLVDWYYSDTVHDPQAIAGLANSFTAGLQRLIDHCLSDGAGGFTPSDFPESGLDQAELDAFLDELT